MHYQVVYDITQVAYPNWQAFVILAGCCIYPLAMLPFRRQLRGRPFWPLLRFSMIGCALFGLIALISLCTRYPEFLRLQAALRQSQCEITEGVVTQFHPLSHWSRLGDGESIVVNGHAFSYREGSAQLGFNHAGLLHDGQTVRLCFLGGDILRLEIAQPAPFEISPYKI